MLRILPPQITTKRTGYEKSCYPNNRNHNSCISIFYFVVPVISFPTVKKNINSEYYYTQQETGMAFSIEREDLLFYKKRNYWFDKEIGHIDWKWGHGDTQARIIEYNQSKNKRLILTSNNHIILDTVLNFEEKFDFEYDHEP